MTSGTDIQQQIREVVFRELHRKAAAFHRLGGGRNSQVFRVECDDGLVLAAKAYFQSAQDQRDRFGCEFRAFQFLKGQGVDAVPAPLAGDATYRIGIYEFVAGQSPAVEELGVAEVNQAVAFLRRLKALADAGGAGHFPPASEAYFSIEAILDNLAGRFRRLEEAAAEQPVLRDFLQDELLPARERAIRRCRDLCRESGVVEAAELPASERTLSPSDFGFHNALRRPNGQLVFLDFEYFGWDDPAKSVSDFILHPGMRLSPELQRYFFSGMMAAFPGVPGLRHRVRAVFPLFGLKWCAILLNEFTLEDRARRCFAGGAHGAGDQAAQIQKARSMLARAMNDDHDFLWNA
jgi:hypothetical protein